MLLGTVILKNVVVVLKNGAAADLERVAVPHESQVQRHVHRHVQYHNV